MKCDFVASLVLLQKQSRERANCSLKMRLDFWMDLFRAAEVATDAIALRQVWVKRFSWLLCVLTRSRAHSGPLVTQQVCLRDRTDWWDFSA